MNENTNKELWRKDEDDYYSPSIHVTQNGCGIGISIGGHVIVMPIEKWHALGKFYHEQQSGSAFERCQHTNSTVNHILRSGGSLEDVVVELCNQNEAMLKRLIEWPLSRPPCIMNTPNSSIANLSAFSVSTSEASRSRYCAVCGGWPAMQTPLGLRCHLCECRDYATAHPVPLPDNPEMLRDLANIGVPGAVEKLSKVPDDTPPECDANSAWRVVSAAMLMDDGLVVPGVRHFSPEMQAVLHRIYGTNYHLRVKMQGFVDARGNFLTREEAWVRADQNGQIFLYDPSGKGRLIQQPANKGTHEALCSEDLY